jgi:hypothetical protein
LLPSVSSLIQGFDGAKRSYFPVGPAAGKKQLQLEEEEVPFAKKEGGRLAS